MVEAARGLFIKRGLAGVNMDLIAAEAGVARQTLYNRFGSKEAIFRSALDAHWAALDAAAEKHLDANREPDDVLTDVADAVLDFIRERDQIAMTRMILAESRHDPDLARLFFDRGKRPLLARLTEYLTEATRQHILLCPDPQLAAREFLGMIQESLLWPLVMGAGAVEQTEAAVVASAKAVFLSAYLVPDTQT